MSNQEIFTLPYELSLQPDTVHTFIEEEYTKQGEIHSFPTRRSSDLQEGHGAGRAVRHAKTPADAGRRTRPVPRGRARPPARDRKSTRLNSSHQIISYAVFCLKKKTKQPQTFTY